MKGKYNLKHKIVKITFLISFVFSLSYKIKLLFLYSYVLISIQIKNEELNKT